MGIGFWLVALLVLAAAAIWGFSQSAKQAAQKRSLEEKLRGLPGFVPQRTLIKTSMKTMQPRGISLDGASQQLCVIVGESLRVIPFSSVIETSVIVDGGTITKASRSSQALGVAVGAVLGGGVGAVIGGLSGATHTKQNIKNVTLRVVLNDLNYPIHDIDFMEMTNNGKTLGLIALPEAEEWHTVLKVIVFQGKATQQGESD